MATANDVEMKANLPGEPSSKSQRVGEEVAPVDAAEAAKRKAILESVSDAGLKGCMSWMFDNTDKNVENNTALGKSVEVLDEKVSSIDARTTSTEARLAALERRDAASVNSASSTMTHIEPGWSIPRSRRTCFNKQYIKVGRYRNKIDGP